MPKGNCVAECLANRTQLYRGNGFLDRNNIMRFFLNAVNGDKEWEGIIASTVTTCMNESKVSMV